MLQVEPALVCGAVVVVLECDGSEQDPGRDSPPDHHVLSAVQKTISWDHLKSLSLSLYFARLKCAPLRIQLSQSFGSNLGLT